MQSIWEMLPKWKCFRKIWCSIQVFIPARIHFLGMHLMGIAIWLGNDTGKHVNKEESPRLEIWDSKENPETSEKSCHRFQGISRDSSPTVCCNISQHLGWFESIQHQKIQIPQLNPYLWGHYQHDSSYLPVTCRVSWWCERQGCRVLWWTLWSKAFLYGTRP